MRQETISNFETPQIPLNVLKDMGFIFDSISKKWILNIGNPLVWYEIKLPEFPTWIDFRLGLCVTLDEANNNGRHI